MIEGDGESWRATAQDTHAGSTEYTYTSTAAVNGVTPGSVRASSPQPAAVPAAPGASVIDVGLAIDIDALATALMSGAVTTQMVCEAAVVYPGTHTAGSSVPDHVLACESAAAASNATWRSVLAAMLKAGGRVALQQLALDFVGAGTEPASPPEWVGNPEAPRTPPPVPTGLPNNIWRVVPKADRLTAPELTPEEKQVVVTQCLALAARAGIDGMQRCNGDTPIFLSGRSDTPEPTQHDFEAIRANPMWLVLNRQQPPNDRAWLQNHPSCAGRVRDVRDCDEFPFASTKQGGERAEPPVSLRVLDASQNRSQGRKLLSFFQDPRCNVGAGDEFWAVPLPERPGLPRAEQLPTLGWCDDDVVVVPEGSAEP
ncbi:NucA/NucB deoxyribonuclease domain-containing protein [Actinotalea subterranea]|uniref:NucA/NucB deoxyribonuclease domain-containing protein n=1 Tax=Actinotalea subterranea TaxID=2607497 RepID=UPI0011F03C8D|nr:NucA/NucB deoxyribonuclease domain-containing protein [Actinotalea subterranea]